MVEGDAKNYFDDLNGPAKNYHWSINSLSCDVNAPRIDFNSCSFVR